MVRERKYFSLELRKKIGKRKKIFLNIVQREYCRHFQIKELNNSSGIISDKGKSKSHKFFMKFSMIFVLIRSSKATSSELQGD